MTYASNRGSATASGASGTTAALATGSLTPGTLLLIAVGTSALAKTVSSIAVDTGTGTFTQIVAKDGATKRFELWLGRNFGSYPISATVTFAQTTGAHAVVAQLIDTSADLSSAPTLNPNAGSTGTSTTADSGTVAPTVGDLLVAGAVWSNGTASSARTNTVATFLDNTEVASSTTIRTALDWCQAAVTDASGLAWTIGNVEWVAAAAGITLPADPAATTALLYKGRLTATADQAATA